MEITWLTEGITFWVEKSPYIWIIFDIINICSGILIVVMFVLLKPNVFRLLKIKYPCFKRFNPYCPSFMLEESNISPDHGVGDSLTNEQGLNATTNLMSEDVTQIRE